MKIFLGYAREHEAAAREAYGVLRGLGHEVWFDLESLIGGDNWDAVRRGAQDAADLAVHLFSREINERKSVAAREIRYSIELSKDQPFTKPYIIVVLLDDSKPPIELLTYQYIDASRFPWPEHLKLAVQNAEQWTPAVHVYHSSSESKVDLFNEVVIHRVEEENDIFSSNATYPEYIFPGDYWKLVNSKISSEMLEGHFGNMCDFRFLSDDAAGELKHYSHFGAQEFFRSGDFVSIQCLNSVGYAGAAHPNHWVRAYNFLGEGYGHVSFAELIGNDDSYLKVLFEYCKITLSAQLRLDGYNVDEFDTLTLDNYGDDVDVLWKIVSEFTFNKHGLTIYFSPYEILPFAFGIREVQIPWSMIEDHVNEKFGPALAALRA